MMNRTYFQFLDSLRESGQINMFGAAPVLADMYDLSKSEARTIVKEWMETYGERKERQSNSTTPVVETSSRLEKSVLED